MSRIVTEKKIRIEIPPGKKKERIDVFLSNAIEHSTRSKVQKLIKAGLVLVNGESVKSNYLVNPGDTIDVTIPIPPRPEETIPEEIPLDIVYEDEYLLIVNKPPGMVTHPAFGNYSGTLVNALLGYTNKLSQLNDNVRPGIVHRLDKNTSGLLLIAKDEWTHAQLAKQFSAHTIEREYWAVCWGLFKEKKGEVIGNIARSTKDRKIFAVSENQGKYAHTFYEVIDEYEFASLVKLRLKTGRTHQIRVHMSHIHHPVFGDPTYGGRKIVYGAELPKMKSRVENLLKIMERQALHAKTLGFIHPNTKEKVFFDSEPPEDFRQLLAKLKNTP
ncbi:MAG: RluA family pseudouridine synthase [Melioribacter sp.]|uniref:RluA family pseudouridine synthase n=1 Tax=Melioribacter sp. TaxID=2052167 RepID=UPI003BD1492C